MLRIEVDDEYEDDLPTKASRALPSSIILPHYFKIEGASRRHLMELVPTYAHIDEQNVVSLSRTVPFSRFAVAIESENMHEIRNILTNSFEFIELEDPVTLTTVLHVAAKHPSEDLWSTLMNSKLISILKDKEDVRGTTPLIAACWYDNLVAVQMLLKEAANEKAAIHDTKKTALHIAADLPTSDICQELLNYNNLPQQIDREDGGGNTPLMIAMLANSPCVVVLLNEGANYRKKNPQNGRNILHTAVANGNHLMVEYLVQKISDIDFLNSADVNHETPLGLAIRQYDMLCMYPFLASSFRQKLLADVGPTLHHLVLGEKYDMLELLLKSNTNKSFFNYFNEDGETVLLYAVKLCRNSIVELLLKEGIDFTVKNSVTGESILHTGAYTNDSNTIRTVLSINDIEPIFYDTDFVGLTAYEIILGKAGFKIWMMFIQTGFVDKPFVNVNSETSLFIAAKEGNYILVKSLLASDTFLSHYDKNNYITENDINMLEIRNEIYPSDVYIALNNEVEARGWSVVPHQDHLFRHNNKDQNIFHACALGHNLDNLIFLYQYCQLFNDFLVDFDAPDIYGNTPLSFAALTGSTQLSKFFIQHGGNVMSKNFDGGTPLDAMCRNIPSFYPMLQEVLNECATTDASQRKHPMKYMSISYHCLCPDSKLQMTVISSLSRHLNEATAHRTLYIELLNNAVIEYFVLLKWQRLKNIVGLRFFLTAIMVSVFSVYLSFSLCDLMHMKPVLVNLLWYSTFFLSLTIVFFSIPVLYMQALVSFIVIIMAPFFTFFYLLLNSENRFGLEVGAIAVLLAWMSLLMQGYISNISFQVSMFYQVVRSVVGHLPMCILVLFAFSNCFFTLFHDFFSFNNPLHSFLTTAVLFLGHGVESFPLFGGDELEASTTNTQRYFKVHDEENEKIIAKNEMWNLVVEGSILLLFRVLISVCILDMLIRLAIREGESLELEGKIHRIRIYVTEVESWEKFLQTRFYKLITKLRLSWLFGVPTKLKSRLIVPTVLYPFEEEIVEDFAMYKLKYIANDLSDVALSPLQGLLRMIQDERGSLFKNSFNRRSVAAKHLKWIYKHEFTT